MTDGGNSSNTSNGVDTSDRSGFGAAVFFGGVVAAAVAVAATTTTTGIIADDGNGRDAGTAQSSF